MTKLTLPPLEKVLASLPQTEKSLKVLEARLKPSKGEYSSGEGFIGAEENIKDIITADYLALKELGLNYDFVSLKLNELIDSDIKEIGNFNVAREGTCGYQQCPWMDKQDDGAYVMWLMPKESNKEKIIVSGIMPHLIKEHYFFEGTKSKYRVDPKRIGEIINLI